MKSIAELNLLRKNELILEYLNLKGQFQTYVKRTEDKNRPYRKIGFKCGGLNQLNEKEIIETLKVAREILRLVGNKCKRYRNRRIMLFKELVEINNFVKVEDLDCYLNETLDRDFDELAPATKNLILKGKLKIQR